MEDWALLKLLPTRWLPPSLPIKYDEVIVVNWLEQELDNMAPQRMPILMVLTGWRNREVWEYVKTLDWTAM